MSQYCIDISDQINFHCFITYIVWAHQSSLTLPLFIQMPVPSQVSKQSHICLLGYWFCFFLPFWYCILELFRQYRNFIISHFIVQFQLPVFKITKILSVIKSNVIVLLLRALNFNDLSIKWVSHCCLRQFSNIMARTS